MIVMGFGEIQHLAGNMQVPGNEGGDFPLAVIGPAGFEYAVMPSNPSGFEAMFGSPNSPRSPISRDGAKRSMPSDERGTRSEEWRRTQRLTGAFNDVNEPLRFSPVALVVLAIVYAAGLLTWPLGMWLARAFR